MEWQNCEPRAHHFGDRQINSRNLSPSSLIPRRSCAGMGARRNLTIAAAASAGADIMPLLLLLRRRFRYRNVVLLCPPRSFVGWVYLLFQIQCPPLQETKFGPKLSLNIHDFDWPETHWKAQPPRQQGGNSIHFKNLDEPRAAKIRANSEAIILSTQYNHLISWYI